MSLKEAIAELTEAIALDADNEELYYERGLLAMQAEKWEAAIADFTQALKLNPQHIPAYANRGTVFRLIGDLKRALKDFNEAIRLESNAPDFYTERAKIFLALNNTRSALYDLDQALRLQLSEVPLYSYCKPDLENRDKFEESITTYGDILQINPAYTDVYLERALVYALSHKFAESIVDLETYLQRGDGTAAPPEDAARLLCSIQEMPAGCKTKTHPRPLSFSDEKERGDLEG
jgi:tetratricopeptide (TPR) repeat protein